MSEWNNILNKIEVTGKEEDKIKLYTALYHCYLQPVDKTGEIRNGYQQNLTLMISMPFGIPSVYPSIIYIAYPFRSIKYGTFTY